MNSISIIKSSDSIYFIQLGNTKISLTAFITLLSGFILAAAIVLYLPNSYNMAMFIIIGAIIAAYEINCSEVGKCDIWAWSLTAFYFMYSAIVIYFLYKNRHHPMEFASDIKNTMDLVNSKLSRFI